VVGSRFPHTNMVAPSMKPPSRALLKIVEQWIHKADVDYHAVEILVDDEFAREIVAFHCQQAAEKYIKALLTIHGVEFSKTHDIGVLLKLLRPVDEDLTEKLAGTKELSPFGVEIRYPGDFPEVLPGGEKELFALATLARDAIMPRLKAFLDAGESRLSATSAGPSNQPDPPCNSPNNS